LNVNCDYGVDETAIEKSVEDDIKSSEE